MVKAPFRGSSILPQKLLSFTDMYCNIQGQKEVVFIEAETIPDNKASQRVLEKCGFVPDGTTGKEGPRFVLEQPLTNWSPIYMLFGNAIGMSIGQLYGQILWGMAIGMSLGILVGVLINNSAQKNRDVLRQQRYTHD